MLQQPLNLVELLVTDIKPLVLLGIRHPDSLVLDLSKTVLVEIVVVVDSRHAVIDGDDNTARLNGGMTGVGVVGWQSGCGTGEEHEARGDEGEEAGGELHGEVRVG